PNEPAGFSVITERSFSNEVEDGWTVYENTATFDIVNDPTAPKSPGSVGRCTFPAGYTGSGSSSQCISVGRNFQATDLYIHFWIKYDENWYGHDNSGVNKLFYLTGSGSGGAGDPLFMLVRGSATGPL